MMRTVHTTTCLGPIAAKTTITARAFFRARSSRAPTKLTMFFSSQCNVEIVCVTNSTVQADICRRKFEKFNGRVQVVVSDFDRLELADEYFDAIYAFESIGYTKDLDAWLVRCWRSLKPGGRLLIRSPGSLDACRREHDYRSVTAFFENWRYNFLGANLLVF